jgi:hypothetical protein
MEFAEQSASGSEQHFANMDEDVARPGGWAPAISMLDSYLEHSDFDSALADRLQRISRSTRFTEASSWRTLNEFAM